VVRDKAYVVSYENTRIWQDYRPVIPKAKHMTTENKKETFGDIIAGDKLVLIDFTAEWCGPCKMMKPILEELRQRMGEKIRILKIDIDRSPTVSDAFNIQSVPTLMLIRNRNILWRQSGVMQVNQLERIIDKFLVTSNT
jgi:thioredoxin 1